MWPFSTEATVTARRIAEEMQKEKEREARHFLVPEELAHKAAHLEEDEEHVFVGAAIVPPEEPVCGPMGTKGDPGIPGPAGYGSTRATTHGVPNDTIRDLHNLSMKTGIQPEILLSVHEEAVKEIPNVMLQETRNND